MLDGLGRKIDYLRISVTDRCNLRCTYCMPSTGVSWLPQVDILTDGEILRLAGLLARLGVRRIRLTGGEPLVRRDLADLVRGLKGIPGIETVALTTNGTLLAPQLPALLAAGLDGVNLSLDTLDPVQFSAMTRRDALADVLTGLKAALAAPNLTVKLNCVPTGDNRNQWLPLAALARNHPISVRFIELMPIGLGKEALGVAEADVRRALEGVFGPLSPCPVPPGGGPCHYVRPAGFAGRIGFISALSHPFCAQCNRVRLTATGFLKPCLQYGQGVALRPLLAAGLEDSPLLEAISAALAQKPAGHHFGASGSPADEGRDMYQIGG